MSFITQEAYATASGQLVERLGQLEARLNDLFTRVDDKFLEHANVVNTSATRVTQLQEQYNAIGQEVSRQETNLTTNLDRVMTQINET